MGKALIGGIATTVVPVTDGSKPSTAGRRHGGHFDVDDHLRFGVCFSAP